MVSDSKGVQRGVAGVQQLAGVWKDTGIRIGGSLWSAAAEEAEKSDGSEQSYGWLWNDSDIAIDCHIFEAVCVETVI